MHFGSLAVCIFFFFSGFFLNRSIHKVQNAYHFFRTRCLRIFPCLIVVVFICTFVLGSCVTECSLKEYFGNSQTYMYLLNIIFVLRHNLPGVFTNNAYDATVNGSLWTLPVEFVCYIGCYFAWKIGLTNQKVMKYTIPLFGIGYTFVYILPTENSLLQGVLRPCGMFYCGMLFDTYRDKIRIKLQYVLLCLGGLILTSYFNLLEYGIILFLPYILVYIVFGLKWKWSRFAEKHEISYGMYLCAWPIQQTIVMLFGGSMNPILNFFISIPFVLMAGYLLNILVEKPLFK